MQIVENLYTNTLSNAMADLYISPAATKTLVTTLHIENTGVGVNVITLAKRVGGAGTDFTIYKKALAPGEYKMVALSSLLKPTDVLRGKATTASEVSADITGVTIT